MAESSSLVNRIVIPLLCGIAGGAAASLLFTPAAPSAPSAPPAEELRAVREELAALTRSIEELRSQRQAIPQIADGGGGELAAAMVAQVMADLREQKEKFQAAKTERTAAQVERMKARSAANLVELKTIQKNTPEATTQKNVVTWIRKLGFSPEDQQKVADAGAPYVRKRTEAIIGFLEQSAQGSPPPKDVMSRQLAALEVGFQSALPMTLDPEARAAVLAVVNARVRMPFFLDADF